MAHDDAGLRWVFGTGYRPDQDPLQGFTDQRVAELVRAAAGLPDLEVRLHPQIPGTDLKVLGFTIGAQLAHSYRAGQVFLVGDATCTAGGCRCGFGVELAGQDLAAAHGIDDGPVGRLRRRRSTRRPPQDRTGQPGSSQPASAGSGWPAAARGAGRDAAGPLRRDARGEGRADAQEPNKEVTSMRPWTRLQDYGVLIAGLYAALSPIWVSTTGERGAFWALIALGVLMAVAALSSLAMPGVVATEWLVILFGVLLFAAPWVLGYTDRTGAAWTSWVVGVVAVVLGASSVPGSTRAHRQAIQP
jgi:hypothetical protein